MPAEPTRGARTVAGAALPKAAQEISRRGGQRRVECFTCGECSAYVTAAAIRNGRVPLCYCGAGVLVPSHPDDCAELAPHLADRHPVLLRQHERELAADLRAVDRDRGGWALKSDALQVCGGCTWSMPDGADPEHWLCPKCGGVNDRGEWSKTRPFGVEAERARGLVQRRAAVKPAATDLPETRAERAARILNERISDDLPF